MRIGAKRHARLGPLSGTNPTSASGATQASGIVTTCLQTVAGPASLSPKTFVDVKVGQVDRVSQCGLRVGRLNEPCVASPTVSMPADFAGQVREPSTRRERVPCLFISRILRSIS